MEKFNTLELYLKKIYNEETSVLCNTKVKVKKYRMNGKPTGVFIVVRLQEIPNYNAFAQTN